MTPYCFHGAKPPSARLVTPKVAATAVLRIPAYKAKRKMSQLFSNTLGPLAKRITRKEPSRASRVLPVAMPTEVRTEPAVVTLTRNAPIKMAGQKRRPRAINVATAMPVGGHTGVALGWTEAKRRLSLAATT